ncbi:MAG: transketolase [Bacteroidia bacterium]|nr:transketolase [Bacteroidia bacterium]MCX7651371.1 transketolase [Bacteroidia bacterium]MDW8416729.1 transketolase [Bacteroidia bacterium]
MDIQELEKIAAQVRRDAIRMIYAAQSGHPGGALGAADIFVALYFAHMRHKPYPFSMDGIGEDVFILSNGHICAAWYSVLARSGYFPIEELKTFRRINSRLQGHPATKEKLPGVRIATGSLGQGLSVAIGIALGKKLQKDPHLVYVMIGDGESNEGQIWEAALFAAHHRVDNLIAITDRNYKQIDGDTRDVLNTDPLEEKWRAFGWETLSLYEAHSLPAILSTLREAVSLSGKGKPVMIIAYTTMGKGVDFMENDYRWHGKAPAPPEYERAIAQLPPTLQDF